MSAQVQTFGQMAAAAMARIHGASLPPTAKVDMTATGLKRLEVAAQGLPVTLDELAEFFVSDLQGFGNGSVTMNGIRKACEWYAFSHKQRSVYWWERDKPSNVVVL